MTPRSAWLDRPREGLGYLPGIVRGARAMVTCHMPVGRGGVGVVAITLDSQC